MGLGVYKSDPLKQNFVAAPLHLYGVLNEINDDADESWIVDSLGHVMQSSCGLTVPIPG